MNYGLYLSASALRIDQYRQDVIANNLANVNTTSFKRDLAVVASRKTPVNELGLPASMSEPVLDNLDGGLTPGGTYTDFSQGPLQKTESLTDLALDGDGFFAVQSPTGQVCYTRDGRLARDADGYLTTIAGRQKLLDAEGQPVRLPEGPMHVDDRGLATVGDTAVQLGIVRFDNPQALIKTGQNAYCAPASLQAKPTTAPVRQGFIEGSGVEPSTTLVDMLTVQRSYDASAKMIQFADSMLGHAVNEIARIS